MEFSWDGRTYINERAIATQQTGFWFVGQSRGWLPDAIGGLLWFGCDDAATSYLTPIYTNTNEIPECFRVGNGDILHYSPTSSFWMNNRVANACYKMYNQMAPYTRAAIDKFENEQMFGAVEQMDAKLLKLYGKGNRRALRKVRKALTRYSVETAQRQFDVWTALEQELLVKFMDGNVKAQDENGQFLHSQYNAGTPEGLLHPDYTEKWKEAVARDHGNVIEVK